MKLKLGLLEKKVNEKEVVGGKFEGLGAVTEMVGNVVGFEVVDYDLPSSIKRDFLIRTDFDFSKFGGFESGVGKTVDGGKDLEDKREGVLARLEICFQLSLIWFSHEPILAFLEGR